MATAAIHHMMEIAHPDQAQRGLAGIHNLHNALAQTARTIKSY